MNIAAVVGIGLTGALLSLILKQYKPEYAVLVSIITGVIVLVTLLTCVSPIIETIRSLADNIGEASIYAIVLIKALAICYITQLACDSCKDAGETAIANKVELAGKIAILLLSLPMFEKLTETVKNLIL